MNTLHKLQSLLHGGNVSAIFSIISDKKNGPFSNYLLTEGMRKKVDYRGSTR